MQRVKTLLENIRHFPSAGFLRSSIASHQGHIYLAILLLTARPMFPRPLHLGPARSPAPSGRPASAGRVPLSSPDGVLAGSGARSLLLLFYICPPFTLCSQFLLRAWPHQLHPTQNSVRGGICRHLLSSQGWLPMGRGKGPGHFLAAVALIYLPHASGTYHRALSSPTTQIFVVSVSLSFANQGPQERHLFNPINAVHSVFSKYSCGMLRCLQCSKDTQLLPSGLEGKELREEPEEIHGEGHKQAELR